mmetsp:Transcript_11276/g.33852  ORF Transcript_11276/g.33852 Transcript_11276/m.33852 type:complete len:218 (+) Transcript_11276:870-1523(+)
MARSILWPQRSPRATTRRHGSWQTVHSWWRARGSCWPPRRCRGRGARWGQSRLRTAPEWASRGPGRIPSSSRMRRGTGTSSATHTPTSPGDPGCKTRSVAISSPGSSKGHGSRLPTSRTTTSSATPTARRRILRPWSGPSCSSTQVERQRTSPMGCRRCGLAMAAKALATLPPRVAVVGARSNQGSTGRTRSCSHLADPHLPLRPPRQIHRRDGRCA